MIYDKFSNLIHNLIINFFISLIIITNYKFKNQIIIFLKLILFNV